jgi:hypothetical protein
VARKFRGLPAFTGMASAAHAGALPNLLVIGAAKCGTTSLHRYLDSHPEVSMASPSPAAGAANDLAAKEMRFFWRDDWQTRMDWYCAYFAHMSTPVRGEATPAYSAHPYHPGVAERIHRTVPGARLIYLVRDPIERIVAHYVQQRVDGERRSFAERMSELEAPAHSLVCPSRYATQLERYLALFDPSQILVVDQHDLRHRRRETLARIFTFVDVRADFWCEALQQESNTREQKYYYGPLARRLFRRILEPLGARLAPAAWPRARPALQRALAHGVVDTPSVGADIRSALREHLAPEANRLRELTGQRFAGWSL